MKSSLSLKNHALNRCFKPNFTLPFFMASTSLRNLQSMSRTKRNVEMNEEIRNNYFYRYFKWFWFLQLSDFITKKQKLDTRTKETKILVLFYLKSKDASRNSIKSETTLLDFLKKHKNRQSRSEAYIQDAPECSQVVMVFSVGCFPLRFENFWSVIEI